MNVYLANFPGQRWAGSAVVVAADEKVAKAYLLSEIRAQKIPTYPTLLAPSHIDLTLIDPHEVGVFIADDGDE